MWKTFITVYTKSTSLLLLCLLYQLALTNHAIAIEHNNNNYGYIYWENGYPTPLKGRREQSKANIFARENPDLVIQTGYYSLMLDCANMSIKGFNPLSGSDYLSALNEDVTTFTPAQLKLYVKVNGVRYDCTSAKIQTEDSQLVRIIENGQYLQRFDHLGLIFKDNEGNELKSKGRFEISAWPDRTVLQLNFNGTPQVTATGIELTTQSGKILSNETNNSQAILLIQPQKESQIEELDPHQWIKQALFWPNIKTTLDYSYDKETAAITLAIPSEDVSYPKDKDRIDEYIITVTNPYDSIQNIPLIFKQDKAAAITGTLMTLWHITGCKPITEPVQISKNWHKSQTTPHEGPWLRGSTFLTLKPKETQQLKLKIIYGYWHGAATASHSQLSVIGYKGNWKWDQSALGSWGESMTFDPSQHLASCFIADTRPSFTTPKTEKPKTHVWTESSGGADFLVYYDEKNEFRSLKRQKTAYIWTGPNITKVHYSGVTDDDKIRANYTTSLLRSNDYHRHILKYQYKFLKEVNPTRLAFFQLGAEYYTGTEFQDYCIGDINGKKNDYTASTNGDTVIHKFTGNWLAIDDKKDFSGNTTNANRGLISYKATLNGEQHETYLHTYNRNTDNKRMLFDLSGSNINNTYYKDDIVKGSLGYVLTPDSDPNYWGENDELAERLKKNKHYWESIYDEFRYNRDMPVTSRFGILLNTYPIDIWADNDSDILAFVVIHKDFGIGHIPVILRNVEADTAVGVQIFKNDQWLWINSSSNGRRCYQQGVTNSYGTVDYAFNIKRPTNDISEHHKIRILKRKYE